MGLADPLSYQGVQPVIAKADFGLAEDALKVQAQMLYNRDKQQEPQKKNINEAYNALNKLAVEGYTKNIPTLQKERESIYTDASKRLKETNGKVNLAQDPDFIKRKNVYEAKVQMNKGLDDYAKKISADINGDKKDAYDPKSIQEVEQFLNNTSTDDQFKAIQEKGFPSLRPKEKDWEEGARKFGTDLVGFSMNERPIRQKDGSIINKTTKGINAQDVESAAAQYVQSGINGLNPYAAPLVKRVALEAQNDPVFLSLEPDKREQYIKQKAIEQATPIIEQSARAKHGVENKSTLQFEPGYGDKKKNEYTYENGVLSNGKYAFAKGGAQVPGNYMSSFSPDASPDQKDEDAIYIARTDAGRNKSLNLTVKNAIGAESGAPVHLDKSQVEPVGLVKRNGDWYLKAVQPQYNSRENGKAVVVPEADVLIPYNEVKGEIRAEYDGFDLDKFLKAGNDYQETGGTQKTSKGSGKNLANTHGI